MQPFKTILARAAKRKGGEDKLAALLPKLMRQAELARIPDDRVLAEMTKRIFSAGFAWTVIEAKWPGFEEAFLGFLPKRLLAQPDEYWEQLASDTRIVRNGAKIASVRANAAFIAEVSDRHGGFAKFLADWPPTDQIGLMDLLAKKGARLGGKTGQFFLRFLGKDAFVLSADVVACLRDAGLDVAENPKLQEGFAPGPGPVQRLDRGDGAATDACVAHLRHVDRGEFCAGGIGAPRRYGRVDRARLGRTPFAGIPVSARRGCDARSTPRADTRGLPAILDWIPKRPGFPARGTVGSRGNAARLQSGLRPPRQK